AMIPPGNYGPAPLEKRSGLQGPIDDAFIDGFMCVSGSETPLNSSIAKATDVQLERFRREWDKYLRGSLRVVADKELAAEDIATKNLVLFGDPQSNAVLGKMLDKLPLKWTKNAIELGGRKYDTADHLPVLIYPNPLNPKKY